MCGISSAFPQHVWAYRFGVVKADTPTSIVLAPATPGNDAATLASIDAHAEHNQKCDDYRRLSRNRDRRRRLQRTTRFNFDEFEAWHEPGDWVTPAQVDDAHDAADAIANAIDAAHAMQTASDALEAVNAARAITSVPAGNDHHITADPVVSPITTNGPNGYRGHASVLINGRRLAA